MADSRSYSSSSSSSSSSYSSDAYDADGRGARRRGRRPQGTYSQPPQTANGTGGATTAPKSFLGKLAQSVEELVGFDDHYFARRNHGSKPPPSFDSHASHHSGSGQDADSGGGADRRKRRRPMVLSMAAVVAIATVLCFVLYRVVNHARKSQHERKLAQLEASHAQKAAAAASSDRQRPLLSDGGASPSPTNDTITAVLLVGDAHLNKYPLEFAEHLQKIFESTHNPWFVNVVLVHFHDRESGGLHAPCSIMSAYRSTTEAQNKISFASRISCYAIDKSDLLLDRGTTRRQGATGAQHDKVKKFIEQTDAVARFRLLRAIGATKPEVQCGGFMLWMDSDVELVKEWDLALVRLQRTASESFLEMDHRDGNNKGAAILTCAPPSLEAAQTLADDLREKRRQVIAEETRRKKEETGIHAEEPSHKRATKHVPPDLSSVNTRAHGILDAPSSHWCPGTWQRFSQWHPLYGTPEPCTPPLFLQSTIASERGRPLLSPWFSSSFAFGPTAAFVDSEWDPRMGPTSSASDFVQLLRLWCNNHRTFVPPVVVAAKVPKAWAPQVGQSYYPTYNETIDTGLVKTIVQQYKTEIESRITSRTQTMAAPSASNAKYLLPSMSPLGALVRLSSVDWIRRGISAEGALGIIQYQVAFLKERDILVKYGDMATFKRVLAETLDFMATRAAPAPRRTM